MTALTASPRQKRKRWVPQEPLGLPETETPEREPFHIACRPMTTLAVSDKPQRQREARLLIAAGWIGLQDRSGRIVEVGKPGDRSDMGRVFRLGGEPARDPFERAAIELAESLTLIARRWTA